MRKLFTDAYADLVNLKNVEGNKACVILSSDVKRSRELADTFEKHTDQYVNRFTFAELLSLLYPEIGYCSLSVAATEGYLISGNPDYIIVVDQRDDDTDYPYVDALLDVFLSIGKTRPVIIISESGAEMIKYSKRFKVIEVLTKNETSLRLEPFFTSNDMIYKRNAEQALDSGIFYVNESIFDSILMNLVKGDKQFEDGCYSEALYTYLTPYFNHNSQCSEQKNSPLNLLITMVIVTRILACLNLLNNIEKAPLKHKIKNKALSTLNDLDKTTFSSQHEKLYTGHRRFFLSIIEDNVPLHDYTLFLHNFIF